MKKMNRWIYAVIGTIVLMFAGIIYAWSVLSVPIRAEFPEWSSGQMSLTFSLVMITFCIGGLCGGMIIKKIAPRIICIIAAFIFLVGFLGASGMQSLIALYVFYGIMTGLASGLVYNIFINVISAKFRDKQGLISGILMMGFGFGSFLIGKIYQYFTFHSMGAWRYAFRIIAIAIFVCVVVGSLFLPGKKNVQEEKEGTGGTESDHGVSPKQMLKLSGFWFFYIWSVVLCGIGLILVGQSGGIATNSIADLSGNILATIVGMISICNGLGRVIFGALHDRKGYRFVVRMIQILFAAMIAAVFLSILLNNIMFLVVGFVCGGLAYGGMPTINSAIVYSFYGARHYRVNFPIINTTLIFASLASTVAGSLFDISHTYLTTIILMVVLWVIGFVTSIKIRPNNK